MPAKNSFKCPKPMLIKQYCILCVDLSCCFFFFHSWKQKKAGKDPWWLMSLNSPHIHLSKGEKIHTYWVVSFSTSCTGKYVNMNGNDGKAFTCPGRLQKTTHFICQMIRKMGMQQFSFFYANFWRKTRPQKKSHC